MFNNLFCLGEFTFNFVYFFVCYICILFKYFIMLFKFLVFFKNTLEVVTIVILVFAIVRRDTGTISVNTSYTFISLVIAELCTVFETIFITFFNLTPRIPSIFVNRCCLFLVICILNTFFFCFFLKHFLTPFLQTHGILFLFLQTELFHRQALSLK